MKRPLLLILFFVAAAGCQSSGADQAHRDIASNHLEIRTYGEFHPAMAEYGQLLKQLLNVKLNPVAGCIVTQDLVDSTDAYNKVMEAEIERRFGPDALTKLWKEAESIDRNEREQPLPPATQKSAQSP